MKKTEAKTSGLILAGTVRERSRRKVKVADKPETEIVTYVVADDEDRKYYLDDFEPEGYYSIGERIEVQVYVKPYEKKKGGLSYSLSVAKEYQPRIKGESF